MCVHSVESIQAFFFYILQYSLSNLNAFVILVAIGYSYTNYIKKENNYKLLSGALEFSSAEDINKRKTAIQVFYAENEEKINDITIQSIYNQYKEEINNLSPIEYIDQLKGYFYLNPVLAISLSITLYSFIGIPPLVGFFAKQMILSSALDNGYIFMCLIAILTSVISAVYYLYIIKHMFFEKSEYKLNTILNSIIKFQLIKLLGEDKIKNITLSS
jgi:NADH-ubiquinone oxidoreductase chain 2